MALTSGPKRFWALGPETGKGKGSHGSEQVQKMVGLLRAFPLEIGTPDDARKILGLI